MKILTLALIRLYQLVFSPGLTALFSAPGRGCRFYPNCSEYTRQSVMRFGVGRGLFLGFKRVLSCHP